MSFVGAAVIHALLFSATVLSARPFDLALVGQDSRAGLAWPNGPWADMQQYTATGKVSWCGDSPPQIFPRFRLPPTGITLGARIPLIPPLNASPCYGANDKCRSGSTPSTKRLAPGTSPTLSPSTSECIRHGRSPLDRDKSRRPEQSSQSNLTAQQGVELWRTYVQPLKAQGIQLGSPASSSAPSGKTWLQDFLSLCGGNCTVDFIALHWYGVNSTQFVQYLQDFHNTFQRPIWVTEWACQVGTSIEPPRSCGAQTHTPAELRQCVRTMLATGCDQLHERHSIVHGRNIMGRTVRLVWGNEGYAGRQ